jgi:DNA sulfur modification protein DndB
MVIENKRIGNLEFIPRPNFELAQDAAYQDAVSSGGFALPVMIAKQGTRVFLSGSFPIKFLEERLVSQSAPKNASVPEAQSATNRPLDQNHAHNISKYIVSNFEREYIIPSITLNVQEKLKIYTVSQGWTPSLGFVSMTLGAKFTITDGQHRVKGIIDAIKYIEKENDIAASRLRQDSIPVMITCECRLSQIHQDFADCSKAKELTPSLLSIFDMRNPANKLVTDLIEQCPLFADKIDSTSMGMHKGSKFLFLTNQIRQYVKHLMFRSNINNVTFEKRAHIALGDSENYDEYLKNYVAYTNHITEVIPVFRKIANSDPENVIQEGLIPSLRDKNWVCITPSGINVLGFIGHHLLEKKYKIKDWKFYADRLSKINWKKNAKIWSGTIVYRNTMQTQSTMVRKAAYRVMSEINFLKKLNLDFPDNYPW